jgi:hypothetical protein
MVNKHENISVMFIIIYVGVMLVFLAESCQGDQMLNSA